MTDSIGQHPLTERTDVIDLAPPVADAALTMGDVDTANEIISDHGSELATEPEILRCFADDLELAGLTGERRTAQIIYLAATSRLQSCFALTSASEKALIYTDEDLRHRMLVLYEADAIAKGGRGAYLLRSLLSEGEIRHETVEKAGKGFATRKIIKAVRGS